MYRIEICVVLVCTFICLKYINKFKLNKKRVNSVLISSFTSFLELCYLDITRMTENDLVVRRWKRSNSGQDLRIEGALAQPVTGLGYIDAGYTRDVTDQNHHS